MYTYVYISNYKQTINSLMSGTRNLKLGRQWEARARAQFLCVCGPNVDLIQLLCACKTCSRVQKQSPWSGGQEGKAPLKLKHF